MLQFNFKRVLYNPIGRILLSILLGIGLACLFHRACKDKDCIHFNGPVIQEVDKKTFEFDNRCYQYEPVPVKCDESKKIIEFENENENTLSESFLNYMKNQAQLKFDPYNQNEDTGGAEFTLTPSVTTTAPHIESNLPTQTIPSVTVSAEHIESIIPATPPIETIIPTHSLPSIPATPPIESILPTQSMPSIIPTNPFSMPTTKN